MADASTLAGFVVASFVLVLVPGPSVLFVISRGVALGRRAAVLTVLGNELGMFVQVLLVAAGVGSASGCRRSATAAPCRPCST